MSISSSKQKFNGLSPEASERLAVGLIDTLQCYVFPIKAGAKFPPLIKDNLAQASNDPEQIKAWVAKFSRNGVGPNWGISLKKSNIFAVDVDTKPGKAGQATYDDLDLMYGFPDTYVSRSPSGGFHKFYRGEHVFALGKNGLGEDVDSPNYIVAPGCRYVGADGEVLAYEAIDTRPLADAPEWFYDRIRNAKKNRIARADEAAVEFDKPQFIKWAIDYLQNDAVPAIEGKGGEQTTLKVAMSLRDNGISETKAVELMMQYYNVDFVCEPLWEPNALAAKVRNAYAYASLSMAGGKTAEADFEGSDDAESIAAIQTEREAAEAIEAARSQGEMPEIFWSKSMLADRWVYIVPLKLFVCRDPGDPEAEDNARKMLGIEAFDKGFKYAAKGKRSISDELLSQKKGTIRRLESMVYKPGLPEFVGRSYNLYRPSPIVPSLGNTDEERAEAQAALKIWDDHLAYLFPDQVDRDLVLNWLAWLLQNLDQKPKHALLLQGKIQGTGKSFIAEMMTVILDPYNVSNVSQAELASSFNRYAMNAKLLLIEELRSVDRRDVGLKLHSMITQEPIPINDKNEKQFQIRNCFGIMAMTNDDAAVYLDDSDRRYLVVRTDAVPRDTPSYGRGFDPNYYGRLYALLRQPVAVAAVAYELLNRDLNGYSAQGKAPMTKAKQDMMAEGADDVERWMIENSGMYPLNARITTVADVIEAMPTRIARASRLDRRVVDVLKRRFKGVSLGKVRLGGRTADRPRLWGLNDRVAGPQAEDHQVLASIYLADRREASQPEAGDFDVADASDAAFAPVLNEAADYDPAS